MTVDMPAPSATPVQPGPVAGPPQMTLLAVFLRFLRFGAFAFGGPVAQIAMIKQALVDQEQWIERTRFNRLLAVLQVLPGPEAHELCVHLGIIARGRMGGLLAGLGFMLPGFILMLMAGWAYTVWVAGSSVSAGLWLGVQIAVLAVIARAVIRIGQHIIETWALGAIAAISLIVTILGAPFWLPLALGGIGYGLKQRPALALLALGLIAAIIAVAGVSTGFGPAPAHASAIAPTTAALFLAGLKGGLLTFGGAYTAIPYIRGDTVGRGWIGDSTFLDGVALAGVLPAPLVIFATFTGYVVGGFGGALAITAGMFLPAFGFSLILFERLEALVDNAALHHLLTGVAAAVLGVIGATFVQLVQSTGERVTSPIVGLILFAAALAAVWLFKKLWITPAVLAAGAVAGWMIFAG